MSKIKMWFTAMLTTWLLIVSVSNQAAAEPWTLANSNSSLIFDDATDSTISTSIYSWTVDASVSRVFEMGLYYRIGSSTTEYPVKGNDLDPAAHFTVTRPAVQTDPSAVTLTYLSVDGRFKIDIASRLTGGAAASRISSLNRNITITNLTASALDFHLFSYNDFELSKPSNFDNVVITDGKAIQSGFTTAAETVGKGVTSVESASIKPDLYEMDTQSLIGSLANGATAYDLNTSSAGPWPTNTDVQYALQWNFNIPASGSGSFDLNNNIYPTKALTLSRTPATDQCVNFGQQVTYTYTFDNAVNTTAFPTVNNLRLVEKLPKDVTFISSTDGGKFDPLTNSVVWTISSVTAAAKTVTGTYLVNSLVPFTMLTSLSSDETYPARLDAQTTLCNTPPSIDTFSLPNGKEGVPYTATVAASDPDAGAVLNYSLDTAPAGMTINLTTGAISWTPTAAQLGNNTIVVRVTDGSFSTTRSFIVTVTISATQIWTVTPSAGSNGSLSPSTDQSVSNNSTVSFLVTPLPGFQLSISGCGGTLSGNTYITGPITGNCSVSASFSPIAAISRDGVVIAASGKIEPDIADALDVLKYSVKLISLTIDQIAHGDVAPLGSNGAPLGDGTVDIADALAILRRVVRLDSW